MSEYEEFDEELELEPEAQEAIESMRETDEPQGRAPGGEAQETDEGQEGKPARDGQEGREEDETDEGARTGRLGSDETYWRKQQAEAEAKGLSVAARQAKEKADAAAIYDEIK